MATSNVLAVIKAAMQPSGKAKSSSEFLNSSAFAGNLSSALSSMTNSETAKAPNNTHRNIGKVIDRTRALERRTILTLEDYPSTSSNGLLSVLTSSDVAAAIPGLERRLSDVLSRGIERQVRARSGLPTFPKLPVVAPKPRDIFFHALSSKAR